MNDFRVGERVKLRWSEQYGVVTNPNTHIIAGSDPLVRGVRVKLDGRKVLKTFNPGNLELAKKVLRK